MSDQNFFNVDVVARLASLEALIVGTMGLLFAKGGNDPNLSEQKALLVILQKELESGLSYLPDPLQRAAKAHMSDLLVRVLLRISQLHEDQRPN